MSHDTSPCLSHPSIKRVRAHVHELINKNVDLSTIRLVVQWSPATFGTRTWVGQVVDADVEHLNLHFFAELKGAVTDGSLDFHTKLPADQAVFALSDLADDAIVYTTIIVFQDDREVDGFSGHVADGKFRIDNARWFRAKVDNGKGAWAPFTISNDIQTPSEVSRTATPLSSPTAHPADPRHLPPAGDLVTRQDLRQELQRFALAPDVHTLKGCITVTRQELETLIGDLGAHVEEKFRTLEDRVDVLEADNALLQQQLAARSRAQPTVHSVASSREPSQAIALPEVSDASSYPLSRSSSAGHVIALQLNEILAKSQNSKSKEVKVGLQDLHKRLTAAWDERNNIITAILEDAEARGEQPSQLAIDKPDEKLAGVVLAFLALCDSAFKSSNAKEPNDMMFTVTKRALDTQAQSQKSPHAQDVASFLDQIQTKASEYANTVRGSNAASAAQREAAKPTSPKKGGKPAPTGGKKPGNEGGLQ